MDSLSGDINFKEYLQYKFEYENIDCFKVKIIRPRNRGYGGTGVYIDSLNGNNLRIGFYGWYLNDKTEAKFIKALKTLSFANYCE